MKKAGDRFYVARHNLSGHWSVRHLGNWGDSSALKDFGPGPKGSLAARRALEARDRLQAALEERDLTFKEMDAIIAEVVASVVETLA